MAEATIRLQVETLEDGTYLATSPDVPGLVVEGRTMVEVEEISRDVARRIAESCLQHGDPLPPALVNASAQKVELRIPVSVD